jgi:hypothetical protein
MRSTTLAKRKGNLMTLAMTRTIHAKECQLHSIAMSCGVSLKTREGTPYEPYVKVDVEGSPKSQSAFLEALELRFGFTQVWKV